MNAHDSTGSLAATVKTDPAKTSSAKVAIVGAGSIGISMAIVFARADHSVVLYDTFDESRIGGPDRVDERLALLDEFGLATEPGADVAARISFTASLENAMKDAVLVLECAPENLDIKKAVFAQLDALAGEHTVLASTSSAFMASEFTSDLAARQRCLIIHPANPPYLLPVVEVVPAPYTSAEATENTRDLLASAGMEVVVVGAELTGFVYNRLQGALLREAYCLVRDGIVDVAGIDTIVRDGLGPRWSIIGPFETVDLNTRGGIEAHAARLGPAYERMGNERGQHDPWTPDLVASVTAQRRAILPLDEWAERVLWRDRQLAALRSWRLTHDQH